MLECNVTCLTCGPVVIIADTCHNSWPISGLCPKCKARYAWHPEDAIMTSFKPESFESLDATVNIKFDLEPK